MPAHWGEGFGLLADFQKNEKSQSSEPADDA